MKYRGMATSITASFKKWMVAIAVIAVTFAILFNMMFLLKSSVILFALMIYFFKITELYYFVLFLLFKSFSNIYLPAEVTAIPVLNFLIPLLLASAFIYIFPKTRKLMDCFRIGAIKKFDLLLLIVGGALITILALMIWAYWANYLGVGKAVMLQYKSYPLKLILIGIVVFSTFNAMTEEFIYRGLAQSAFMSIFKSNLIVPILLQAMLFAAVHYQMGFPNGKLGYLMTFCYACFLGYFRIKTKGLLAPCLVHITSDCCIGIILYLSLN